MELISWFIDTFREVVLIHQSLSEKGNVFEMEKKSEGQASSARESSCSVLTDDEVC